MGETIVKIKGMTCPHCKMVVEKALKGILGVTDVQVDMQKKTSRCCRFCGPGSYG